MLLLAQRSMSLRTQWPQQIAADDVTLDFTGAIPNSFHPCIAPEAFDGIIIHQTHAAMNLQSGIGHPCQHFAGLEFGARNLAVCGQVLIKSPCRRQGQPVCGVDLGDHIGNLKAHTLELANLLAELFAFGGVVEGVVKHPACAAD